MEIALLIEEYLKGQADKRTDDDHINIVNNQIHTWNFPNIPQPTIEELNALIPVVEAAVANAARKLALKTAGAKDRAMCVAALDLIAGFNRERVLTADQITTMQTTFSSINQLLMANRPTSAKSLISAIVPDETVITSEMKALVLEELANA